MNTQALSSQPSTPPVCWAGLGSGHACLCLASSLVLFSGCCCYCCHPDVQGPHPEITKKIKADSTSYNVLTTLGRMMMVQRFFLLKGQNLLLKWGWSQTSPRAYGIGLYQPKSRGWQVEYRRWVRKTGVQSQFHFFQLSDLMGKLL